MDVIVLGVLCLALIVLNFATIYVFSRKGGGVPFVAREPVVRPETPPKEERKPVAIATIAGIRKV